MEFAGMKPEQLGRVKVTSVSECFLAEKEWQTVTRRGAVLACVGVPTVRKIEVELLMRAKNRSALPLLLEKVRAWLEESGEEKLHFDSMGGTYYKARCTGTEAPTYSGASARLKVTFTCVDYRRYRLYDDKPVGGADPCADNFTFGGKHCLNDMGCMFVLDKRTAVPAPVLNKYEVSGMAGTLRFERAELMLKERKVSGKLYFVNREQEGARLTDEQVEQRMHDVAAWLLQAGRAELVMDADISRSIMAEIEDEASLTCDKWENGVMDISFAEQPLWQDAAMSTATQAVSLAAGTWQTIDLSKVFPRGMGYTTPLTLDVMNTGSTAILDFRIRYRDRLGKQRQTRLYGGGFSLTGGQSLRVDGENLSVVCGGQSMISALCEGDFPSVPPNAVNIEIMSASAAAASVTVSARARWL